MTARENPGRRQQRVTARGAGTTFPSGRSKLLPYILDMGTVDKNLPTLSQTKTGYPTNPLGGEESREYAGNLRLRSSAK